MIRRVCWLFLSPESSMNRETEEMKPPHSTNHSALTKTSHLQFKASWWESENYSLTNSTQVIKTDKEETHWGHWATASSHQGKQSKREYLCRGGQIKMFPVAEGHWPQALKCPVSTWPPRGLTKSKFLQPRSTPSLGEQVLLCDLQRCFIFHCIPLLLKSCTSVSPKFILSLTRRLYFSLWPHAPWQQAPF